MYLNFNYEYWTWQKLFAYLSLICNQLNIVFYRNSSIINWNAGVDNEECYSYQVLLQIVFRTRLNVMFNTSRSR